MSKSDDLFRELGYSRVDDEPYIMYEDKNHIAIEIADTFDEITKWDRICPTRRVPFTYAEIRACFNLINEQEQEMNKC